MGLETDDINAAMAALRRAGEDQAKLVADPAPVVDPTALPRFSPHLPENLDEAERERLEERVRALEPWLQGPFLLGGDLVVGGRWRNDTRWEGLGAEVPEDLSGSRVLDVGANAGYDPFMFRLRNADEVIGCEPFAFIEQARFLESVYRTGVDFRQLGWQELDPTQLGRFDLVHCHGVLYHDLHPVALLQRLRDMVADEGRLYFGSMMLADVELSEYARFVPGSYFGDSTWWWVPGRLAMRWMLEAVGFEIEKEFGIHDGPPGEFRTINGYFRCKRVPPAPDVTFVQSASGPPPAPAV